MDMYQELTLALERQQLSLVYQPRVNLQLGKITGVEALLRWHHPSLGTIPPGQFIPLAEERGLIATLGDWVLTEATRQAGVWKTQGRNLVVAVNLSPQQLSHEFSDNVAHALEENALKGTDLELELTETSGMIEQNNNGEILEQIRKMGVHLALDDFGSGYSSLTRLQELPFDVLKLDKCLIYGLPESQKAQAIVASTLELATNLSLHTVAEGIEQEEQLVFLQKHNCREVQGYLLARPSPFNELNKLLQENRYTHVCKQHWRRMSPLALLSPK